MADQPATHYVGPHLSPYIQFDEHVKNGDSSIKFSDISNYHYMGTITANIRLPAVEMVGKNVTAAWPNDVIPLSIDTITMTSASIVGKMVPLTGEIIATILHWWRSFDTLHDQVVGNIPILQTFSRRLPSYESNIRIPLFWNNKHPLPINLCTDREITITIKMKDPKSLLRIDYGPDLDKHLDHGNPELVEALFQRISIRPETIGVTTTYRISKSPEFVKLPEGQAYRERAIWSVIKNVSPSESINRIHELKEVTINKNVLGFMWHLQPIYLNADGKESDIHADGNYSLDPLEGSTHDPVYHTEITITRGNGEVEVLNLRGTYTRQSEEENLLSPFGVGHHIITFGTNPFEGLKYPGKDITNFAFKCTSSDQFIASPSSVSTPKIDINAEIDGDSNRAINLNIDGEDDVDILSRSSRSKVTPSLPSKNITYKLVVFTIVSGQMEINNGNIHFK